ncbi:SHOCT domain-containing protein [Streptomyces sp. NPDC088106]|uniref:SHOCT domain-containing protein n=1 Tax=Streptomyces sp. NPDC088106 TaxID=3154867 RepID=UPI0034326E98
MSSDALMTFKSHIEGKNADVAIYHDRVEWARNRGMSAKKLTAGFLTGGASLLATGVRSSDAGTEMIPVKNISSVVTKRDINHPVQAAAPSSQASTPVEQLRQLAELRDAGILSEEEFTTKKAEILARM